MTCWICVSVIMRPPVEGRGRAAGPQLRPGALRRAGAAGAGMPGRLRRKHGSVGIDAEPGGRSGARPAYNGGVGRRREARSVADGVEPPGTVPSDGPAYTHVVRSTPPGGVRTPLDRRRVLAAAIGFIDEHGLEALTM